MLPFNSFAFPDRLWNFQVTYKCYSVSMLPGNLRLELEKGGKIIMPPSALETLTHLQVSYPMLFKLKNEEKEYTSHAGVLEFIADEGKCYLPRWMMNNLRLEEEDNISIESVSLPVATFSKFQPLTSEFLDITNPKAVLENALRNFACLTTDDVIAIQYNEKIYELCVLQTRPGNAVTIIECDMNVEFEAPADYQSPSKMKLQDETVEGDDHANERTALAFEGSGVRLDGKKKKPEQLTAPVLKKFNSRGIPDYDYSFGVLKFDRTVKPISDRVKKIENVEQLDPDGFEGRGSSMK